jgi:uncharacterized protein (TIGR02186 family)
MLFSRSNLLTFALLVLAGFISLPAQAKPLVADISGYRVNITSDFRGTRLFLFGARGATGQVVVVVRGPETTYLVQKKERVLGMWLVREQVRFMDVPQYYSIYSSAPLDFITSPELRRQLGLGLQFVPMTLEAPRPDLTGEALDAFRARLRSHQQEQMLYSDQSIPVRFIGETLFKSDILFPDSIRPGQYIADVYLVDGNGIAASQSIPIRVRKRGLEAFISRAAHEWPLFYGLCAVFIAGISGWAAHRLFRRI